MKSQEHNIRTQVDDEIGRTKLLETQNLTAPGTVLKTSHMGMERAKNMHPNSAKDFHSFWKAMLLYREAGELTIQYRPLSLYL